MTIRSSQSGYTLVELLVTMTLFSLLAVGFYNVVFGQTRGSNRAQSIVQVSQEARGGFNRMVRDTREAQTLSEASPTAYRVQVDFDANGVQTFPDTNTYGDYEDLTFAYNATDQTITLNDEVLMAGVLPVSGRPIFDYTSNLLEYDWNADGVTTWRELDEGPSRGVTVGNGNGRLDIGELPYISDVDFALRVRSGDSEETFFSRAQLRNRRTRV